MRRSWFLITALVGCAGTPQSTTQTNWDKIPITGTGPRCRDKACSCRPLPTSGDPYGSPMAGDIPEGEITHGKRFEIRTGRGLDPIAVTISGLGTLRKTGTSADDACSYVELAPGKYPITVHARASQAESGMVPSVFISEFSSRQQNWYRSFSFRCGDGNELCMIGHLEKWRDEVSKLHHGEFDPCGSVQIEDVTWSRERDMSSRITELTLSFVLHVYKFSPSYPHGHAACMKARTVDAAAP